ncbi:archaeal ATPase [Clostridium tepidiprofundi DSM 19306]|uniref:Archaeal ATPase n=1 Tax=Clostridium tepidiprofundi DSM 19306 TaxID=1121338 RepID=A0A151B2N7_9CLOT|nr:ATP-binding protein [Clostridium tepidiprofundi]KYH34165.1 archaeal ATPase [Clostridium tepidiprofundi DSM 19306]
MFVGRSDEIFELNRLYDSNKFEFAVVYGRRRVGKTTLLTEFCKDKNAIFYVAEEYNDKRNLENFSDTVLSHFNMKGFIPDFTEWYMALKYIGKMAESKRIVLVIDEFPYTVAANKSIPSILQNVIDHYLKDTKLFLIICGSSMSFMEKEVLSYKSPLFGRKTAQFKIEPFDFFTSCEFFKNYSNEDKILAYGILGGIPQYLQKFDYNLSIEENIKNSFFNKNSYFYDEPRNILKQELREPIFYNSIIESIAKGASKLNEISTKVGEPSDKCAKYLKNLLELGILDKEIPLGEKETSRKTLYKIKDNMFCFWFKFVFGNAELIEQKKLDYIYKKKVFPFINDYLGSVFEDICIQYLRRKNINDELPFIFDSIGRWWGNNPIKKCEEEIDIICRSDTNIMFGECKWRNEPINMRIVNSLIEKAAIFNMPNKYYIFFSKSGFKKEVIDFNNINKNIILITLDDMIEACTST